MIYAIAKVSKLTNAHLNLCGARKKKNLRTDRSNTLALIKFNENDSSLFSKFEWISESEARLMVSCKEWQKTSGIGTIWAKLIRIFG